MRQGPHIITLLSGSETRTIYHHTPIWYISSHSCVVVGQLPHNSKVLQDRKKINKKVSLDLKNNGVREAIFCMKTITKKYKVTHKTTSNVINSFHVIFLFLPKILFNAVIYARACLLSINLYIYKWKTACMLLYRLSKDFWHEQIECLKEIHLEDIWVITKLCWEQTAVERSDTNYPKSSDKGVSKDMCCLLGCLTCFSCTEKTF